MVPILSPRKKPFILQNLERYELLHALLQANYCAFTNKTCTGKSWVSGQTWVLWQLRSKVGVKGLPFKLQGLKFGGSSNDG